MNRKKIAALFISAVTLGACNKVKDPSSDTSALTNQNLACFDYTQAQYQQLQSQLSGVSGFFNNFPAADQPALMKHFAAVPASYRNQLISLKKAGTFQGIFKRDLGSSGVMGVCSSNARGPREIGLTSRYPNAINFAMIHEIGHAVESMVQKKAGKTNRDWEAALQGLMAEATAYNSAGGISRAQQVRDYAFHSDAEFFAESFHNYYCSPATHAFIKQKLPKTYAFLTATLDQPVWMNGSAPQPTTPPSTTPTTPPAPVDVKGETLAQKHVDDVAAAYNKKSTRCDLSVRSVKMVEADGDFFVDISAQRSDGQQLPAVRLRTNYKLALESELKDLKALVPKVFPGCPGE
jgi:hypothetical protein